MSDQRPFGRLERRTVAERVRDDIHNRIISGELQPGSQLPAERALAEQFEVARTSVREAIQALVAIGLIERRGNRSHVVERVPGAALPELDGGRKAIRSAVEARQVLELTLFELAAARATARERNDALAMARRPAPSDIDAFSIADREFHAAIAGACGNPVLVEIYGRVVETLVQSGAVPALILGADENSDPAAAIARAAAEHLAIAEHYTAGDVEAMLHAVDDHLGTVQGRMSLVGRIRRRDRSAGDARDTRLGVGL